MEKPILVPEDGDSDDCGTMIKKFLEKHKLPDPGNIPPPGKKLTDAIGKVIPGTDTPFEISDSDTSLGKVILILPDAGTIPPPDEIA